MTPLNLTPAEVKAIASPVARRNIALAQAIAKIINAKDVK